MADKYYVFNKNTGVVTRIGTKDEIINSVIDSNESISVFNENVTGQVSFVDERTSLSKGSVPENVTTNSTDLFSNSIPGPIDYQTENRLLESTDVMARLILGGQHVTGTTLAGSYAGTRTGNVGVRFTVFPEFNQLKAVRDDHFQIVKSGTTLDGIYKVKGTSDFEIITEKVTGATVFGGSTGTFNSTLPSGHNIIRLQPVAGSLYGLSAGVEGVGSYQFGEDIEQSVYKVENIGNVSHTLTQKKFGSASARFEGKGSGTTGPHLFVNSTSGFTFANSSTSTSLVKHLFKLSAFVRFDDAAPSSEMVICGKKNDATGVGAYLLKYDNSPSSFVFTYSTVDGNPNVTSSFNKTMVASNMAGVILNDWTHIQVEFGDLEGRLYTNGTLKAVQSLGATEEIFQDMIAPFVIGAESNGTDALAGYIDHVEVAFDKTSVIGSDHFLDGGASGGTLALGTSLPVPAFGATGAIGGSGDYSKLRFPMNGVNGSELFIESSLNVVEADARVYDDDRRVLTISNYGFTGSGTAFTSVGGFLRGQNLAGGNTAGIVGNSEATHPIINVELGITSGLTLTSYQDVLTANEAIRFEREKISVGLSGATSNFGDFVHSFGGVTGVATAGVFGTGGTGASASPAGLNQLTFYASDPNTDKLIELNELIGVCAAKSEDIFYFTNVAGFNFGVFGYEISRMLTDVLIFRNGRAASTEQRNSDIIDASAFVDLHTGGKSKKGKPATIPTFVFGGGD